MGNMDDLLVQSRFRNLILWELMAGKTAAECADLCGVSQGEFGKLLNLAKSPLLSLKKGKNKGKTESVYSITARRIANFYKMLPEDLFHESLYSLALPDIVERTYCSAELVPLLAANKAQNLIGNPSIEVESEEMRSSIAAVLKTLPPRREAVLKMRFGIDCEAKTLEEIGRHFNLSVGRIRQIEQRALQHIRHPSRAKKLKTFY